MTKPAVQTVYVGGARYYVHPDTGERVPGVTSVLGVLDKPALVGWAAKMTAGAAADKIESLARIAETSKEAAGGAILDLAADRRALEDDLKRARFRRTGAAIERGEDAHARIEQRALGIDELSAAVPWADRAYDEFVAEFDAEPVAIEATAWSEEHGYAGTFDGVWRIGAFGGRNLLLDVKTGNGVYGETALQLAAYRYAGALITPHGEQEAMPAIHGAAVWWVRPEGWALYPVRVEGADFDGFLAALGAFRWRAERQPRAIGDPVNAKPLRKTARS